MNRREALSAATALLGGTIVGAQAFLAGCSRQPEAISGFTDDVITLFDEIGDTIIPSTVSSPGAKAARIVEFMKTIVTDCYSPEEQSIFFDGLSKIRQKCAERFDANFERLNAERRQSILLDFDMESREYDKNKTEADQPHFFTMIKQLTIWGYFSSEVGATQALRYVPIPGRYESCVDYKDGVGAWVY